jgi:uncharacterized repeat protein (TIGR01451 family)
VTGLHCVVPLPASLAPGAKITCTATHVTTADDVTAGSWKNTATGAATYGETPLSVTADATVTFVSTPAPKLTITKTADTKTYVSGQLINYSYLVTNTGNVTIANIAVIDNKLATVTCPETSLAPTASTTCTAAYTTVDADVTAGAITNKATVTGDPSAGTLDPVSDSLTVTAAGPAPAPKLTITKTADPTTFSAAGQTITYTIVLTNSGNVAVTDPSVTDSLVTGLHCVVPLPASLAPGAKITCTATHVTTADDVTAGSWKNTATGAATYGETPLSVTADATVTFVSTPAPKLTITKTADRKSADVGQTIAYTIVLTNSGDVALSNPSVSDPLVGSTLACDGAPTSLAPGAKITCTATYVFTQADVDRGSVTNIATGTANSGDTTITVTADAKVTGPIESFDPASATPPLTSTPVDLPGNDSTPIFALLICFIFGALALVMVQAQRGRIRR